MSLSTNTTGLQEILTSVNNVNYTVNSQTTLINQISTALAYKHGDAKELQSVPQTKDTDLIKVGGNYYAWRDS